MPDKTALIFLANDTRFTVTIGDRNSMTSAWRELFAAASDPTVPAGEVMAAAKKLSSFYGLSEANIPRVHIRHIQGKIAARDGQQEGHAKTGLVAATEVKPTLPEMYAGNQHDYGNAYLDETLIPALNLDLGTPHLLPSVIHFDKAAATLKPYSARARAMRPLPNLGNFIGLAGAGASLFFVHDILLLLAGMAVIIPSSVLFLRGMDDTKNYNAGYHWVKYWGAERKLRHWLKVHWNIEVAEIAAPNPEIATFEIVQIGMPGNLKIVATNGRTYTLERATQNGRISIMDHSLTHLRQPAESIHPAPRQLEPLQQPAAPVDPLPTATRARINQALALRDTLLARSDLSVEQHHALERARDIITEVEQLATTLNRLPAAERDTIFASLERSIDAAIHDIEQVDRTHLQAAVRQAKILDRYTSNLPR